MNIIETLKSLDLSEHENKLFIACLELGSASVYKISKMAGLPRSTGYEVLEALSKKELVSSFNKKKVKYYTAADPRKILNRAKDKIKSLEQALPELYALYNSQKNLPSVRFYQGVEGMKIILEEILDEAENELLSIGSSDDLLAVMGEYWNKFVEKRIKKKILAKIILRDSEQARERQRLGPTQLREARLMPARYEHRGLTMIWGKKIALFTFDKDLLALVIDSREINKMQKAEFNFMWDALKNKL